MAAQADFGPKVAFSDGLARLAGSADLSDFTITCGQKKWPVHRVVLSLHSSVLARSCSGGFIVRQVFRPGHIAELLESGDAKSTIPFLLDEQRESPLLLHASWRLLKPNHAQVL